MDEKTFKRIYEFLERDPRKEKGSIERPFVQQVFQASSYSLSHSL
jgi:hypothetical protein